MKVLSNFLPRPSWKIATRIWWALTWRSFIPYSVLQITNHVWLNDLPILGYAAIPLLIWATREALADRYPRFSIVIEDRCSAQDVSNH